MKHLKMIGLAVVAVAALMAFAGNAYAAELESGGAEYTGTLSSSATSSLLLKAGFANITCTESTVAGTVSTNDAELASGSISTLSFSNCGGATVDTIVKGSLSIKKGGAVSGSGSQVTVSVLGTSCVYGTTENTALGTAKSGEPATMTISANLPKISGGFACANPASWSGSYAVTTPSQLTVN